MNTSWLKKENFKLAIFDNETRWNSKQQNNVTIVFQYHTFYNENRTLKSKFFFSFKNHIWKLTSKSTVSTPVSAILTFIENMTYINYSRVD